MTDFFCEFVDVFFLDVILFESPEKSPPELQSPPEPEPAPIAPQPAPQPKMTRRAKNQKPLKKKNMSADFYRKEYFKKKFETAQFELRSKKILFKYELRIKKKTLENLNKM